ncbi:scavenger mRNA decapping enzyme [Mytilinidion resinicola]|uniref:Scavenger mRNA decapping enzyme n=1 Tax=Mytilinidion resinicola TaxID=574789 RepID=A0A6A6Z5D8_9PEZI|nr:scavenger mRNA decapping enzyme [Mytilinidion resinicola]KAF2816240.1 scavenger mRNA decapping enzyme [Mytilinidion resinicola]
MATQSLAAAAEALIPRFQFEKLLNQDQAGRRIVLYGSIASKPAILLAERAAFASDLGHLTTLASSLANITNLGANDIYSWFLASSTSSSNSEATSQPPDLKLNLIYPCTETHIKKYSQQGMRMVTETPEIYVSHVRPYMQRKRKEGRLNWVFNIIEGRTEQEQVIYREHGDEGFLLLPDLNWDRKTISSLHLLALVERRDIWSVRDLKKKHVTWVNHMREKLLDVTVKLYPELEKDQLKLYVHYQPTYYHFHIHIVHVSLEAGGTQATGKALGLENIIGQLETLGDETGEAGMADVSLTYHLGEASELWTEIYQPLKEGKMPKAW